MTAASGALLLSPMVDSAFPSVPFWPTGPPSSSPAGDAVAENGGGPPPAVEGPPQGPLNLKSVLRLAGAPFRNEEEKDPPATDDGRRSNTATVLTSTAPPTASSQAVSTTTLSPESTEKGTIPGGDSSTTSSMSAISGSARAPPEHSAFSTGNLLVLSSCLLFCFFVGYLTHTQKIRHLPDSASAMLVGGIFGLLIRVYGHSTDSGKEGTGIYEWAGDSQSSVPFASYHLPTATAGADSNRNSAGALSAIYFDPQFFYLVLLPPIVLDAGLSVSQYDFLRNMAPVLLFAFAGTLTSTLLIYVGLQAANEYLADVGLQGPPHKVRAFLWAFASLISATDTVAIMNILNSPRFFTRTRENRLVQSKSLVRYGGQQVVRGGGELVYASTAPACSPSPSPEYTEGPYPRRGKERQQQELHRNTVQSNTQQETFSPSAAPIYTERSVSLSDERRDTVGDLIRERPYPSLPRMHSTLVNSNLVSILMGESILNDAVSIALTRSVFKFFFSDDKEVILNAGVGDVVADFVLVMAGSIVFGVGIGALCCFSFKHSKLRELPQHEVAVTLLTAYIAFGTAEVLELSGVVSLFACGAMLCHFNTHNLSAQSRLSIRLVIQTIALLCDKCAYAYLGVVVTLGVGHRSWNIFFALFGLILTGLSRAAFVFPFSFLTNRKRRRADRMNLGQQIILWLAGLRGAIAFALAMSIPCDGDLWRKHCRDNKDLVVTTTLVLVVLTTVCVGSSLEYAVMSLSRAYAHRRVSTSRLEQEQETLATAFLPPARGTSNSSDGSATSASPPMLESDKATWTEMLLRADCVEAAPLGDTARDAEETHPEEVNAFLRWYAGIEATYLRHWFGGDSEVTGGRDSPGIHSASRLDPRTDHTFL